MIGKIFMKVILLSNATTGGAGRAAYRLQRGLRSVGFDARMHVRYSSITDSDVIATPQKFSKLTSKLKLAEHIDATPFQLYRQKPNNIFSLQWFSDTALSDLALTSADVLNLHWVGHGYLSIEAIAKLKKPIVWTLHDMWAFTGGCHYNVSCNRYQNQCGVCPQLQSSQEKDLSRWVWKRKIKSWQHLNLTLVSPSVWLAKCAQSSSLFQNTQIEVIPNGLDTQIYRPLDRHVARSRLNLPQKKKLILFGATSPTSDLRKGFKYLQSALSYLKSSISPDFADLVIFGASQPKNPLELDFKCHYLGKFDDDVALSLIYAAADVMVVPSLQEAFGQTASESLSCGTPVVCFDTTGLKDIVDHQKNGYLATPYEAKDLAKGIAWVLEDSERHKKLSQQAREKAEQAFTLKIQAKRYAALFEEVAHQH